MRHSVLGNDTNPVHILFLRSYLCVLTLYGIHTLLRYSFAKQTYSIHTYVPRAVLYPLYTTKEFYSTILDYSNHLSVRVCSCYKGRAVCQTKKSQRIKNDSVSILTRSHFCFIFYQPRERTSRSLRLSQRFGSRSSQNKLSRPLPSRI